MSGFIVLLLAVLSRILPHLLHSTAANVTAVGGSLLFFGSRTRVLPVWLQALAATAVMAATDWYLTVYAYGFPFKAQHYLVTWSWYAGVVLLGYAVLGRKQTVLRVLGAAVGSSTSFFLLSNGMVWLSGHMYAKSVAGLASCYVAGLPFYRNDLASTLLVSGVLFGLPVLARKTAEAMQGAGRGDFAA